MPVAFLRGANVTALLALSNGRPLACMCVRPPDRAGQPARLFLQSRKGTTVALVARMLRSAEFVAKKMGAQSLMMGRTIPARGQSATLLAKAGYRPARAIVQFEVPMQAIDQRMEPLVASLERSLSKGSGAGLRVVEGISDPQGVRRLLVGALGHDSALALLGSPNAPRKQPEGVMDHTLLEGEQAVGFFRVIVTPPKAKIEAIAVDRKWRKTRASMLLRAKAFLAAKGKGIESVYFATSPRLHPDSVRAAKRLGARRTSMRVFMAKRLR